VKGIIWKTLTVWKKRAGEKSWQKPEEYLRLKIPGYLRSLEQIWKKPWKNCRWPSGQPFPSLSRRE